MKDWIKKFEHIKSLDQRWLDLAQARLDEQTRPQGSLGELEEVIVKLVAIQKKERRPGMILRWTGTAASLPATFDRKQRPLRSSPRKRGRRCLSGGIGRKSTSTAAARPVQNSSVRSR